MSPFNGWLEVKLLMPEWAFAACAILFLVIAGLAAWLGYRFRRPRAEQAPDQAFVRHIFHSVANPLMSIGLCLDEMRRVGIENAGVWEQNRDLMAATVVQLQDRLAKLRSLSQLDGQTVPQGREMVILPALIHQVVMELSERANSQKVHLVSKGCERVYPRVLGDSSSLKEVLLNLVDNALKYAKPEGGKIQICLDQHKNVLRVTVSDEGVGIAKADLPHIFDLGYRARDAATLKRDGTGLGLTIVKRTIEQHGGKVWVDSVQGEGSNFYFELPIYAPEPARVVQQA